MFMLPPNADVVVAYVMTHKLELVENDANTQEEDDTPGAFTKGVASPQPRPSGIPIVSPFLTRPAL